MDLKTVSYIVEANQALICLDRPNLSNQVNLTMAMELRQVCQHLQEDEEVWVAILSSKDQVFSLDRDEFIPTDGNLGVTAAAHWLELHRAASALAELKIPLIVAINGDALNHGLELTLACDLRIAEEHVRLGFTDLSKGIIPWDGGTQRLARIVGRGRALEMLLTCRLVDAKEALRIGLVNAVVPKHNAIKAAQEVASQIAAGAPIAAQYVKEAVYKGLDLSLEQGLGLEADLSFILQSTQDRHEGVRAFLEKQKPRFTGK